MRNGSANVSPNVSLDYVLFVAVSEYGPYFKFWSDWSSISTNILLTGWWSLEVLFPWRPRTSIYLFTNFLLRLWNDLCSAEAGAKRKDNLNALFNFNFSLRAIARERSPFRSPCQAWARSFHQGMMPDQVTTTGGHPAWTQPRTSYNLSDALTTTRACEHLRSHQ